MREAQTGYMHPDYADSLREFGKPHHLLRCDGWVLERQIHGFPFKDGMGCYPLFVCRDWSKLCADLKDLETDLISLALVTDPWGHYDLAYLRECFDFVKPFKEHFVADLRLPIDVIVSKHHRYYARKALRHVKVELCSDPASYLEEWVQLYATLVERHKISGIRVFSREAFAKQLSIPGMLMFRGVAQGITVGANLIYTMGKIAYTHLSAFSPHGYDLRAAYPVRLTAIEHLRANGALWINLAAGAGLKNDGEDGLSKFKRGWSTGTRTAYFCGRIFDQERYEEIVKVKSITSTDYFPAYRTGEFG